MSQGQPPRELSDRLFPGSYRYDFVRDPQIHAFLTRVQELAPQVLTDLHDRVLPGFRSASQSGLLPGFGVQPYASWDDPGPLIEYVKPLLRGWAEEHGLLRPAAAATSPTGPAPPGPDVTFGEWRLYPTAYETLRGWAVEGVPSPLAWRFVNWPDWRNEFRTDGPFRIDLILDGWDASLETKAEARDRLMGVLEAEVMTYLNAIDEAARASLEQAPRYFDAWHLDWLVEYQVNGRPYGQIATACKGDRNNVRKAVQRFAGWVIGPRWREWLRPGQRGRRKRSGHPPA